MAQTPAYVLRTLPALVLQAVLLREITTRQFARVPALQVRSVSTGPSSRDRCGTWPKC